MKSLIGILLGITGLTALIGAAIFYLGKLNPNAEYQYIKESGDLTYITKIKTDNANYLKLYTEKENEIVEKLLYIDTKLKGNVNVEIKENMDKNTYKLDLYMNNWGVYSNEYENKIIITLDKDTKVNNHRLKTVASNEAT